MHRPKEPLHHLLRLQLAADGAHQDGGQDEDWEMENEVEGQWEEAVAEEGAERETWEEHAARLIEQDAVDAVDYEEGEEEEEEEGEEEEEEEE
jgi:hypothetical protein